MCPSTLSPGYLHVLRSGHRLWRLLCPLPWENIRGEETASTSPLRKSSYFNNIILIDLIWFWTGVFFLSFRTYSSVRMWPGRHLWLREALLRSFSPLSLVSSSANQEVTAVAVLRKHKISFHLSSTFYQRKKKPLQCLNLPVDVSRV